MVVLERRLTELPELSGCEHVTETQMMVVVHDLVIETVVVELSGYKLVMVVLAMHDGG